MTVFYQFSYQKGLLLDDNLVVLSNVSSWALLDDLEAREWRVNIIMRRHRARGMGVHVHGSPAKACGGKYVLAISGPPGVGKSGMISLLKVSYPGRIVEAEKESARGPKNHEVEGRTDYRYVPLSEILRDEEPAIWSRNVGVYKGPQREQKFWMRELNLARKGIVIPETTDLIKCIREFINRYKIRRVKEQYKALKKGQVLVLEISCDLEEEFAKIFPEMTVIRLQCRPETRVSRLLRRYKPRSKREFIIASAKILESLCYPRFSEKFTENSFVLKDETKEDELAIATKIGKMYGWPTPVVPIPDLYAAPTKPPKKCEVSAAL